MRAPPKIKIVELGRIVPSLPVELLDQIFAFCSPEGLKKISLVSKSFSEISQPLLFAHVVVMCPWQLDDLFDFVEGSGWFAGLVKSLEVVVPTRTDPSNSDFFSPLRPRYVIEHSPNLQRLVLEDRQYKGYPPSKPQSAPTVSSSLRGHSPSPEESTDHPLELVSILPIILGHPSLQTLSLGLFSPTWIPSSSSPPPASTRRQTPLPLPVLRLSDLSKLHRSESLAPALRFILDHQIHVQTLELDSIRSLDDLNTLLSTPIPTLEVLKFGFDNQIYPLTLPRKLFGPLLSLHISLRTVKFIGYPSQLDHDDFLEGSVDDVGRRVWSLLGEATGLESMGNIAFSSGWDKTILLGFEVTFVQGSGNQRRMDKICLSLAPFSKHKNDLARFLSAISKAFPDLVHLRLKSYQLGEIIPGSLRLPPLLPSLTHLVLGNIYVYSPIPSLSPLLTLASCALHRRRVEDNPDLDVLLDPRARQVADIVTLAGGYLAWWEQELLPRIASDIVRMARSLPSLRTVEQDIQFGNEADVIFVWDIERQRGGAGGVRVVLREGSGPRVFQMRDSILSCTCEEEEVDDDPGGEPPVDWCREDHFDKIPLFELEPNFFPAFTLDSFFPRIPRTSPPS